MGSNGEELSPEADEITVLVTGFAPFRTQYPVNPAWEIAHALPPFLPPIKTPSDISTIGGQPRVRILVHPEPVRVSYDVVRELVPKLWDGRKINYAIHIGMATGRQFYSVERRGHRDGYGMKDVDDKLLNDWQKRKNEGDKWVWNGLPEELLTTVDIDDVWWRWRKALPELDLRVSENAGYYLCDFIYYSSLAHLTKKGEDRRVVFLHVPVDTTKEAIDMGTEITVELIRSIVQSGRLKKKLVEL